jgi:hypothetical protein
LTSSISFPRLVIRPNDPNSILVILYYFISFSDHSKSRFETRRFFSFTFYVHFISFIKNRRRVLYLPVPFFILPLPFAPIYFIIQFSAYSIKFSSEISTTIICSICKTA